MRSCVVFAAVVASVFSSAGAWAAPQGQVPPAPQEEEDDDVGIQSIAQTIDTATTAKDPEPGERGRVSGRPSVFALSANPDDAAARGLPDGLVEPRYGKMQIGVTGQLDFVVARSSAAARQHDVLFIDVNGDHKFDNDGPPTQGAVTRDERRGLDYTEFTSITLTLRYSGGVEHPFTFTLYLWQQSGKPPTEMFCVSRSWREVDLVVEETKCRMYVYDESNSGLYQKESLVWRLEPIDAAKDAPPWSEREFLAATAPFRIKNVPYVLESIIPDGSRVELSSLTDAEAITAEFEARPFTTEPTRPKATAPIEWGNDLDSALEQARKGAKRVLLLANVDWNKASRDFAERTLTDEEVVRRARDFVCVRIDLDRSADLRDRFQIDASPTVLFLDPNGGVHDRVVGYRPAREFCQALVRNH